MPGTYISPAETGFYYLQSRYYDSEIGRFINADAAIGQIGNVQGNNMFVYCFNNPVNMSDPTGNWPRWIKSVANWVNNKVVKPIKNFVANISEDFENFDINNETGVVYNRLGDIMKKKCFIKNIYVSYKL